MCNLESYKLEDGIIMKSTNWKAVIIEYLHRNWFIYKRVSPSVETRRITLFSILYSPIIGGDCSLRVISHIVGALKEVRSMQKLLFITKAWNQTLLFI